IVLFCAKPRSSKTSCRPPCPDAATFGTPCSGAVSLPSSVAIRMRPGRSVTSMRPSGRKANAHGCDSPPATVSILRSPAEDLNVCASAPDDSVSKPAATAIEKRIDDLRDLRRTSPDIGIGPLPHQQHEQDRDVGVVDGDAGREGGRVVAVDVVEIAGEPAAGAHAAA